MQHDKWTWRISYGCDYHNAYQMEVERADNNVPEMQAGLGKIVDVYKLHAVLSLSHFFTQLNWVFKAVYVTITLIPTPTPQKKKSSDFADCFLSIQFC